MPTTMNLNEIVNSIVQYEVDNGNLSGIVPSNLKHLEPFADGDNVAVKNGDIVLNGYKVKVTTDPEAIRQYFPNYYEQVSSKISGNTKDEISINDTEEELDAKLSALKDELSSVITSYIDAVNSLSTMLSAEHDILSAGAPSMRKISKRDDKDIVHGIPTSLTQDELDNCGEYLDMMNQLREELDGIGNDNDINISLSAEPWPSFPYYSDPKPDFITLGDLYSNTAADIWSEMIDPSWPLFEYSAPANMKPEANGRGVDSKYWFLEGVVEAKRNAAATAKPIRKMLQLFREVENYVKDYEKAHDKEGLCDIKIGKIKKVIQLFDDFDSSWDYFNKTQFNKTLLENTVRNPSNPSGSIVVVIAFAYAFCVCQFMTVAKYEMAHRLNVSLMTHGLINHRPPDMAVRLKNKISMTHSVFDFAPHERDDVFEELLGRVKYLSTTEPVEEDGEFVVGIKESSKDKIVDAVDEIMDLLKCYQDYMQNGDNALVRKINRYPQLAGGYNTIDVMVADINLKYVTCNIYRKIYKEKIGEYGDRYLLTKTLESIKDDVFLTNRGSNLNFTQKDDAIKCTIDVEMPWILDTTFAFKDHPDYSEYHKSEITECGTTTEQESTSYNGNTHKFELADNSTLTMLNDDGEAVEGCEMSVNGKDLPMSCKVFYKIRSVCQLDKESSTDYPRMNCEELGYIKELSCLGCGDTYKSCTKHDITEDHVCGVNCSKGSGYYGDEDNAPGEMELFHCHDRNLAILSANGIPEGVKEENGLLKFNLRVLVTHYCDRTEDTGCLAEGEHTVETENGKRWATPVEIETTESVTTMVICPSHDSTDVPTFVDSLDLPESGNLVYVGEEDGMPTWELHSVHVHTDDAYGGHGDPIYFPVDVNTYE